MEAAFDTAPELPNNCPKAVREACAQTSAERNARRRSLESIILLVRKLREGLVACRRADAFALEGARILTVYELGVLLSILCGNFAQLASIGRLMELYSVASITQLEHERLESDLELIVGDAHLPTEHTALFTSLWRLEPLCSGRPGHLQEYLARNGDTSGSAYAALVYGKHLGTPERQFWVNMLCLNLIPLLRESAWQTLRRSYITVPLHPRIAVAINDGADEAAKLLTVPLGPTDARNKAGVEWLEQMLYLGDPWAPRQSFLAFISLCYDCGTWNDTIAGLQARLVRGTDAWAFKVR